VSIFNVDAGRWPVARDRLNVEAGLGSPALEDVEVDRRWAIGVAYGGKEPFIWKQNIHTGKKIN
jgi:hypothetical protein